MAKLSSIDRSLLRQLVASSPVLTNAVSQLCLFYVPYLTLFGLGKMEPNPISYERSDILAIYRIIIVADIAGSIISAILMKYIGRRIPHGVSSLAGIIALLTFLFSSNILTINVGSVFVGLSIGGSNSLGSIMLGEYASPKYRGVFLYLKNVMVLLGGLTAIILPVDCYKTIAVIGLVSLIISIAIILVTPESPIWLASKKKYADSEKVFYKLRGKDPESTREIRDLIKELGARHVTEAKEELGLTKNTIKFLRKCISLELLNPFGIILLAAVVQEFSGKNLFTTYPHIVAHKFTSGDASAFDRELAYILMFVSALISVVLVIMCRRRILLFSTGSLAVFMLVLVLFFSAIIPIRQPVIIVTVLSIYSILIYLCCSFLPLVLVGELFPLEHKGVGAVFTGVVSHLLKYAGGMLSFDMLLHEFNIRWLLLIYSAFTSVSLLILYFVLPETKDLTLQGIENNFVKQSKTMEPAPSRQGVELGGVGRN